MSVSISPTLLPLLCFFFLSILLEQSLSALWWRCCCCRKRTETGCAGLRFEHVSVFVSHRCSPVRIGTTREAPEDHRLAVSTKKKKKKERHTCWRQELHPRSLPLAYMHLINDANSINPTANWPVHTHLFW